MVRIAAAWGAIAVQTPRLSKIRRLALPNAVVRSSKLGCTLELGATPSINTTRIPRSRKASARLAPTIPPPTMATSTSIRLLSRHQGFDLLHILRRPGSENFHPRLGNHDVILDADPDVMEP